MILDRIGEIRQDVDALRQRKTQHQSRLVWTTHVESLDELAAGVARPRAFLAWLQGQTDEGREVGTETPAVLRARTDVQRVLEGLERDPDRVLAGDLIGNAKTSIRSAISDLEARATHAWSTYVERLPPPDAELYAGFRGHTDLVHLVEDADRQDRRYDEFRKRKYLDTEGDRREFARLLSEREQTRFSLPDIHDGEVRSFVAAAAAGGAGLDALTANILQWLESNGLTDTYVIRRRPTGIEGTGRR